MKENNYLFFELVKVSLGRKDTTNSLPIEKDWNLLFQMSQRQSLCGLLFDGFVKCVEGKNEKAPFVLFDWYGKQLQIINENVIQNQRAKELYEILKNSGYRSCILKGQGTAQYYEKPEIRQCGDIDIWVTKDGKCKTADIRKGVLQFAEDTGRNIGHVDIKHSDIDFFGDVPVEVHFMPSWMYSPITNKILQRFFQEKAETQFANVDEKLGFAHTTVDFDLVYSMVHIYRHVFSEGIGLRQLVDYYYILKSSNYKQRMDAYELLKSLKMKNFVAGIMWILNSLVGLDDELILCQVNEKHGRFLLDEIMIGGNFGHFDNRRTERGNKTKFEYGIIQFRRNLRFLRYYPSEVLWSPLWKTWHYFWRKSNGYL